MMRDEFEVKNQSKMNKKNKTNCNKKMMIKLDIKNK
jgi:hypothetical protein